MLTNKPLLLVLFAIMFSVSGMGQDRFERLYRPANENYLSKTIGGTAGLYLVLSVEIDADNMRPKVNLTQFNAKGNIDWSTNYIYQDTLFIKEIGEVTKLADGTIAFSLLLEKEGLNKVVTRVDNTGSLLWSVITGRESDEVTAPNGRLNLIEVNGEKILSTNLVETTDGRDLYLTSLLYSGDLDWAKQMGTTDSTGTDLIESIRDVVLMGDSSILILGNTSSTEHQMFLTKMTDSCEIVWSRSYTGDFGGGLNQSSMSLVEMVDGSIVFLGAQVGFTTSSLVVHVDSSGNFIGARSLSSNDPTYELIPNNVVALSDTTVAISMKRLDLNTAEVRPLIFKFNLDSLFFFQTLLKESVDLNIDRSGLLSGDSSTVVFASSIDTNNLLSPYLVKLDENGQTLCSEDQVILQADSVHFNTDTLIWQVTNWEDYDTISSLALAYGGFSPPTLTLTDTFFCPQDPIRYVVDASVPGAVAYIWDDNNTDSIRLFTEEGMYSVTVTVGRDICFELCDTTTITQREFPMAVIAQNAVNFCETGEILLGVSSQNLIREILWSTGETSPVIAVTELTDYSVEIIDDCDNDASASIDLSDFMRSNAPIIVRSDDNLCVDNTIELSVSNIPLENLVWSTGESGVSRITVDNGGTFSAQNIEQFCPGESSITVGDDQFVPDLSVTINETCDNPILLLISGEGIASQVWSDGSDRSFLNVTEAGNYSVTVSDECGNTETASIEISPERVAECIPPPVGEACMEWPNAFIPSSNEENNTSFGPKNDCLRVDSYELRIFNRWGKNIYTSNNVSTRWNGRVDGKDAPGDVYFWWAKYSDGSSTFQDEGDVTLIR